MYNIALSLHSLFRWFVLAILLFAIFNAYRGLSQKKAFSKTDNAIRHWTATVVHIQLMLGLWVYFISPIIKYFYENLAKAMNQSDMAFFGIYHMATMFLAVVFITIGSASAKRKNTDQEKFRTMLIWFSIGLLIILMAVPWPFSPFAIRPYYRGF